MVFNKILPSFFGSYVSTPKPFPLYCRTSRHGLQPPKARSFDRLRRFRDISGTLHQWYLDICQQFSTLARSRTAKLNVTMGGMGGWWDRAWGRNEDVLFLKIQTWLLPFCHRGGGDASMFFTMRWWLRLLVTSDWRDDISVLTCGRRWDVFKTSVYTFQVFQIGPSVEKESRYVNSEKVQLKGMIVSQFWMICLYVSSWRLMVIYMLLHEWSKLVTSRS